MVAGVTLVRTPDGAWLALPLLLTAVCLRAWRRTLPALFAGLAAGVAQWVAEAYARFGGVPGRLRVSSDVEGGLGLHWNVGGALRSLNGPQLCRPCEVPFEHPELTIWWLALPLLAAAVVASAVRDHRARDRGAAPSGPSGPSGPVARRAARADAAAGRLRRLALRAVPLPDLLLRPALPAALLRPARRPRRRARCAWCAPTARRAAARWCSARSSPSNSAASTSSCGGRRTRASASPGSTRRPPGAARARPGAALHGLRVPGPARRVPRRLRLGADDGNNRSVTVGGLLRRARHEPTALLTSGPANGRPATRASGPAPAARHPLDRVPGAAGDAARRGRAARRALSRAAGAAAPTRAARWPVGPSPVAGPLRR
ncbi:hypothetical protein NKH77_10370 [Streptomyces sp. M19]